MKNITLSADARSRRTTLNAAFRLWLEEFAGRKRGSADYRELNAATWRRPERQRASVAGERSTATARPTGGRLRSEVAEPLQRLGYVRLGKTRFTRDEMNAR